MARDSQIEACGLRCAARGLWLGAGGFVPSRSRVSGGLAVGAFKVCGSQIEARRSKPADRGLRPVACGLRLGVADSSLRLGVERGTRCGRLAARSSRPLRPAVCGFTSSRFAFRATCDLRLAARGSKPAAWGWRLRFEPATRSSRLAAGVVQLGLGVLRLGRWFRAVSAAVVQGMLAGIGLVLVAGQVYALGDAAAPADGLGKLAACGSRPAACGLQLRFRAGHARPPSVAQGPPPRRPRPAPRPTEPRSLPAPTSPPLLSPPHLSSLTKIHLHPAPTPVTMAV